MYILECHTGFFLIRWWRSQKHKKAARYFVDSSIFTFRVYASPLSFRKNPQLLCIFVAAFYSFFSNALALLDLYSLVCVDVAGRSRLLSNYLTGMTSTIISHNLSQTGLDRLCPVFYSHFPTKTHRCV